MIQISDCPITGLQRKLTYDFYWLQSVRQIIIRCYVSHFDENELIENARIVSYYRDLVASDNLVNPNTGEFEDGENSIFEYEFYVNVIGSNPVILPNVVKSIILKRDTEGKFNI